MKAVSLAFLVVAVGLSGCLGGTDEPVASSDDSDGTGSQEPTSQDNPGEDQTTNNSTDSTQDASDESAQDQQDQNSTEQPEQQEPAKPPGPKPVWGDPETAPVYPGALISTGTGGCTTNFVFVREDNRAIYIGSAAHCFASEESAPCDPATPAPTAPGSTVRFMADEWNYATHFSGGLIHAPVNGTLAYSSFHTMRQLGKGPESTTCPLNDFALIEIPLGDQGMVTPYLRTGDVPSRVVTAAEIHLGDMVKGYGHSPLWMGQEPLHAKQGIVQGPPSSSNGHWNFGVTSVSPGIFGDSGGPLLTADGGGAMGVVRALGTKGGEVIPGVPSGSGTSYVTLQNALDYMEEHTGLRVDLATP